MTTLSQSAASTARPAARRGISPLLRREINWGLLFLSPWLIGFVVFTLLPMLASLAFSLTNYNPIRPEETRFVGLDNYARLFTDPFIRQSALVTLRFALISVPFAIGVPLGLALLVNSEHLFARNLYRTLFYMPSMIPVVVNVMVWRGVLNETGWVNRLIETVSDAQGPSWFQDETWVLPALILMGIWGVGGAMLTMLAGLQSVPTDLYEAAKVDGANGAQRFWIITLPMISPVIFYNLMLAIIGSFQYFVPAYIISNGRGDPNGATLFFNLYLYRSAFGFLDMGYGATLAWVMFVVVLALTIILFRTQHRWVYYAGGD
jgi:multiple sugar transport system permease protein